MSKPPCYDCANQDPGDRGLHDCPNSYTEYAWEQHQVKAELEKEKQKLEKQEKLSRCQCCFQKPSTHWIDTNPHYMGCIHILKTVCEDCTHHPEAVRKMTDVEKESR